MNTLFVRGSTVLQRVDWWFIIPMLILLTMGLTMQYSIAVNQDGASLGPLYRQASYVAIGLALFGILSVTEHRRLKTHPFVYFGIAAALLLAVLLFGTTIKGTTGWFVIAGVSVQPVEFVKILYILFVAAYLERDPARVKEPRYFVTLGVATFFLIGLILLQPDLGSSAILFFLWFSYLLILRVPRWVAALIVIGVVTMTAVGWAFVFEDYQKDRLITFVQRDADPLGSGYNITQSIVAVGSGSFWGRGLGLGTQSQLQFLPEVSSDFIFAAIAEELGFVGAVVLISAIGLLLFRMWVYLRRTHDYYSFLFIAGVFIYLTAQSVLTIGMNIGILPVTGLPLPLVSAGGSSVIATLALLGAVHHLGITSQGPEGRTIRG